MRAPVVTALALLAAAGPAEALAQDGDIIVRFKAAATAQERSDARGDAEVAFVEGLAVPRAQVSSTKDASSCASSS